MNIIKTVVSRAGLFTSQEVHDMLTRNLKQYTAMINVWKTRAEKAEAKLAAIEEMLKEYMNEN